MAKMGKKETRERRKFDKEERDRGVLYDRRAWGAATGLPSIIPGYGVELLFFDILGHNILSFVRGPLRMASYIPNPLPGRSSRVPKGGQ